MSQLRQTVESAVQQTYPHLEIILVDGGSTDDSLTYMQSLRDRRIRVETLPAGTTAAQNWTAACQFAGGDYIKLLCQDDILHPQAVAKQVNDLQQHPGAVMALAQRDIIDASGSVVFRRWGTHGLPAGMSPGCAALQTAYIRGTNIFGEPLAVLFPRHALLDALPWNDDRPFLLDLELYTRVMLTGYIFVRKESIGAFRISARSWSTRMRESQTAQLQSWQHEIADRFGLPLHKRFSASAAVHVQSLVRRSVYRLLTARGSFHPSHVEPKA